MMPTVVYPLDTTGAALSNKVLAESNTLLITNQFLYLVTIPKAAPYFLNSLIVTHVSATGVRTALQYGIDWMPAFYFRTASLALEKPIYGGIIFNNNQLSGSVELDYQTLGTDWTIDTTLITQVLSDLLRNPRTIYWEEISNKPTVFPPSVHSNEFPDDTGHAELIEAINNIGKKLLLKYNGSTEISLAVSDAVTPLNAGLLDNYARCKGPIRLVGAKAALGVPSTVGDVVIDVSVNSASILTTPIRIPQGSDTSKTAVIQPSFSQTDFPDDTRFNFTVTQPGQDAVLLHVYLEFIPN